MQDDSNNLKEHLALTTGLVWIHCLCNGVIESVAFSIDNYPFLLYIMEKGGVFFPLTEMAELL